MSIPGSQDSPFRVTDLLATARNKGVKFWCEAGQLRYRAPAGALTPAEVELLRSAKGQIISTILGATGPIRAPLSFSQLAHWNLYRLSERRSFREVASVTRLIGHFNAEAFRKSVAENVRRHDALRTRIVVVDGTPEQEVVSAVGVEPEFVDLTATAECDRAAEIERQIEEVVLRPIDTSVPPLFAIRLLRLSADEHVLILANEHMISDAFSVGLLLRDLLTAYAQLVQGVEPSLPSLPLQFHQYATRQQESLESMLRRHGAHWNECLQNYRRVRFPPGELPSTTGGGWGEVPIEIGGELKGRLTEWCRLQRTTMVMAMFAAYVALSLRWCGSSQIVTQYITDGRDDPDTRNVVGYFASVLYLRITLGERNTFLDLVKQVTEEYCRAYANSDSSYLESQMPRPDFTRSTAFNWIPQGAEIDISELQGTADSISCTSIQFKHPRLKNLDRDSEPAIVLFDTPDRVVGGAYFPAARYSPQIMERYVRNLYRFLHLLVYAPDTPLEDVVVL